MKKRMKRKRGEERGEAESWPIWIPMVEVVFGTCRVNEGRY
jgi:hypothetical protein